MGSYSADVKAEILETRLHSRGQKLALLSAIVHTAGSLFISSGALNLVILTQNANIKKYIDEITLEIYKVKSEVVPARRMELVYSGGFLASLLADCGIVNSAGGLNAGIATYLTSGEGTIAAYIMGAFLGAGSISAVDKYHMEFSLSNLRLAEDISHLLAQYEIVSHITERKEKFVVYIKDSQSISDCLALVGAAKAVLSLNDLMVKRERGGYANRIRNCDMYNLDKTVNAAVSQRQAIEAVLASHEKLDEKMLETARARLNNPESSIEELALVLGISKSGARHRLDKFMALAKSLD